jgi:nucleoside-diphosphate-sugar epimerase
MASVMGKAGPAREDGTWTESDWSDEERLRSMGRWYALSKTLAERAAWDFVREENPGFELFVVNPTLVIGPMLQPSLNTSCAMLKSYVDGSKTHIPNSAMSFVDVRDVAHAHYLLATADAPSGRHICVEGSYPYKAVCATLREVLPDGVPDRVPVDLEDPAAGEGEPTAYDLSKLKSLGLHYRPLPDMLRDTLASLAEHGHI